MSDTEFATESAPVPAAPPAGAERRAVIDIGTNSIKLLVADVGTRGVCPLLETSEQTRLGRGFYKTHQLQKGAIQASLKAIREFTAQARTLGADSIRLIATSAVRDAKNSREFTTGIREATGLDVEVISGEQEADWAFAGVSSNARLAGHELLVLDVGGGSTEFIFGRGLHPAFRKSFALGTVRLMEQWELSDPPDAGQRERGREEVADFLRKEAFPLIHPLIADQADARLVGTGGTPAILARIKLGLGAYDRDRIESTRLSADEVQDITCQLWSMPLEARKHLTGLPPERADVILSGALIYWCVMQVFGFDQLDISTRGLRFAVVAAINAPSRD